MPPMVCDCVFALLCLNISAYNLTLCVCVLVLTLSQLHAIDGK